MIHVHSLAENTLDSLFAFCLIAVPAATATNAGIGDDATEDPSGGFSVPVHLSLVWEVLGGGVANTVQVAFRTGATWKEEQLLPLQANSRQVVEQDLVLPSWPTQLHVRQADWAEAPPQSLRAELADLWSGRSFVLTSLPGPCLAVGCLNQSVRAREATVVYQVPQLPSMGDAGFHTQGGFAATGSCEFVAGISCNLQRPILVLLGVILISCALCCLCKLCKVRMSRQRQCAAELARHPCRKLGCGGDMDDIAKDDEVSNISAVPVDCKEVLHSVVHKELARRKEVLLSARPVQLLEDAFDTSKKQDSQEVSEYSTSVGSGTLESKPPSPSSGQGTASTGSDSLSHQAEGSAVQFLPELKEVVRVLWVTSPNGQYVCAGEYHLVPAMMPNGMPAWQQKDGEHYLYSAKAQTWCIAGHDVVDRQFDASAGWIYQGCRHGGLLPHETPGHWLRWNGQSFEVDSNIQVSHELQHLRENPETRKDYFKTGSGSFSKIELLEMVLELTHVGGEEALVLGNKQTCIVFRLQAGVPSCVGPSRQRSLFNRLVPRLPLQEDLFELLWWPPRLFLHKPLAETFVAVNGEILEKDHAELQHGAEVTAGEAGRGPLYTFRVVRELAAVHSLLGALKAAPAQGMSVLDLRGSRLSREERRALGSFKDETLRIVI